MFIENPETGEVEYKEVLETYENETEELIHVHVNGEDIVTTPSHPFYVNQFGWTRAAQLRAGDVLVLSNGEYVVVEFIQHEILESPVKVYNFEVEDFHTYFVGESSVLVHNGCGDEVVGSSSSVEGDASAHKTGTYLECLGGNGTQSHHIIQNAAVKNLPGYSYNGAPAIQLKGPATTRGTEHYIATQNQRLTQLGGTYRDERKVAYVALRRAGLDKKEAYQAIKFADGYFIEELGIDLDTVTRIPLNRR